MRFDQNENQFGRIHSQKINSQARHAFLAAVLFAPMALLWGCSGVVSGQNTQPPPPQTYSISGTISPVAGGSGATVALSGAAGATTTANSSGIFTFSGLANGAYTVAPTRAGYTFSPTSLSVTVSGANITTGLNFTATVAQGSTYSISGTISPVTGGSGATVTLSGAGNATTTADGAGNYNFTGLANGNYALTASHAGYTLSPTNQAATINGANITGLNFTAAVQTFSISGTISPVAGGSGATVALSGAAGAATTANSSGNYNFTGLANGNYTVTPSHTGYTFNPINRSVTVSGANVTAINFTATPQVGQTFSISGTISPAAGGSGATVALSGAASASTTANSSGNYTFTGLANGNYAVTPSHAGYTFSPTSQAVTVNGANVTGLNFTATAVQTFSISGTISPAAGGSGATVTLSGPASANTTSNSSGNYTFSGLANGMYTVTPSNAGYTFTPVNQSVTINGTNVSAVNFIATPQLAHSAALSWTASTSAVSGYNVYRGTVNGGPYTLINLSLVAGLSYTDTAVQSGVTYYYVTTAVDSNGVQSVNSNQVTAVIP